MVLELAGRRVGAFALCGAVAVACAGGDAAVEDRAIEDGLDVRLDGEGQTWRATLRWPAGDGREVEVPLGREVHAPLGAEVRFALASRDYICDFALPELGARDFAAPGLPGQMRVRPARAGRYALNGDELCGLPHGELARGWLVVEDHAAWRRWLAPRLRAASR